VFINLWILAKTPMACIDGTPCRLRLPLKRALAWFRGLLRVPKYQVN
jgi:hypothetical protein